MVKVVVNNGQYKITIPKDIAEARGWTSQTQLIFVMTPDGEIILKEFPSGKNVVLTAKVKVVVNNQQYKITIPKDIAEAKGWTSHTRLIFIMIPEGDILLKEIKGGK